MKIFAKEELVRDGFVQAAAPSGTAVYSIPHQRKCVAQSTLFNNNNNLFSIA